MTQTFALDLNPGTSALERLLSVVRRRGFRVEALIASSPASSSASATSATSAASATSPNTTNGTGESLRVEITVSGSRDMGVLERHLSNLCDCALSLRGDIGDIGDIGSDRRA